MIYLLRKNLEILPFVIIPKLSPQIFNDELAIDILYIEFAHRYLLFLFPLKNQLIRLNLCYLRSTLLISFLLRSLCPLLHYISSLNYWFPCLILLIRRNIMVLSEIVKMIESSNKCLYFPIEKSYLFFSNKSISLIIASHYLMEDVPKFYILLTKQAIR